MREVYVRQVKWHIHGLIDLSQYALQKVPIESYKNAYNYSEDKKPQFESSRVEFTVTLMNLNYGVSERVKSKVGAKTIETKEIEERLLDYLRENPNLTQTEFLGIGRFYREKQRRYRELCDLKVDEKVIVSFCGIIIE